MDTLYDRTDYFGYKVISIAGDGLRLDNYLIEDLSMSYYLDDYMCSILSHLDLQP